MLVYCDCFQITFNLLFRQWNFRRVTERDCKLTIKIWYYFLNRNHVWLYSVIVV